MASGDEVVWCRSEKTLNKLLSNDEISIGKIELYRGIKVEITNKTLQDKEIWSELFKIIRSDLNEIE